MRRRRREYKRYLRRRRRGWSWTTFHAPPAAFLNAKTIAGENCFVRSSSVSLVFICCGFTWKVCHESLFDFTGGMRFNGIQLQIIINISEHLGTDISDLELIVHGIYISLRNLFEITFIHFPCFSIN